MTSKNTNLTIVYSSVYSGADQRKHQSSASLAFVGGIHRWPVNSLHKGAVTRKCFLLMTSSFWKKIQNGIYHLWCWYTVVSWTLYRCPRIRQSCRIQSMYNTMRPRHNGRHFADDIFKCIFLNEYASIPIKISQKFIPKGSINNILALVQIMAWCRLGDKPLSEPVMASLPTSICAARPQWVNGSILIVKIM